MAYGLSTRLFVENGPTNQAAQLQASRSTARSWRALDASHRIALVEQALKPANDCLDAYPFAL
jgi:hypothetical protein